MAQQHFDWWDELDPTLSHIHEIFSGDDAPLVLKALRDRTCMVSGAFKGMMKEGGGDLQSLLKASGIVPYSKFNTTTRYSGSGVSLMWSILGDVHTLVWTASSEEWGADVKTMVEVCLVTLPEVKKVPLCTGSRTSTGSTWSARSVG